MLISKLFGYFFQEFILALNKIIHIYLFWLFLEPSFRWMQFLGNWLQPPRSYLITIQKLVFLFPLACRNAIHSSIALLTSTCIYQLILQFWFICASCLNFLSIFWLRRILFLADIGVYLSYCDFLSYVRSNLVCTKELNRWFSTKFEKVFLFSWSFYSYISDIYV
jgi:hypothetical protein